jgi:hypothetical protein
MSRALVDLRKRFSSGNPGLMRLLETRGKYFEEYAMAHSGLRPEAAATPPQHELTFLTNGLRLDLLGDTSITFFGKAGTEGSPLSATTGTAKPSFDVTARAESS